MPKTSGDVSILRSSAPKRPPLRGVGDPSEVIVEVMLSQRLKDEEDPKWSTVALGNVGMRCKYSAVEMSTSSCRTVGEPLRGVAPLERR